MKSFLALFLAIITFVLASMPKSMASVPPAEAVHLNYGTTPVGSSTFVRIVDTAARAIQGVLLSNSSLDAVYLAVGASSQPYGSEESVAIIPASATVFMPLPISGGQRISVKSTNRTLSWGTLNATFIYY